MKTRVTVDISDDVIKWLKIRYGQRKGVKALLLLAANEIMALEAKAYLAENGYAGAPTKEAATRSASAPPSIDYYILPIIPSDHDYDYTESVWRAESYAGELQGKANDGDLASLWALETIARLQALWIAATDRIAKAQEALEPTE